jgi:hypothetical protein
MVIEVTYESVKKLAKKGWFYDPCDILDKHKQ